MQMKSSKITVKGVLLVLLVIGLLLTIGFKRGVKNEAHTVYQVYLDGEKIGLIANEQELFDKIDNEQENIKEEFDVDRVYPPEGLETKKYITYDENLKSVEEVYNTIEDKSTFTIPGYTIIIKPENEEEKPTYINVLNKDDVKPALMDAASAFINIDSLNNYINETQPEVKETGKTIESVYFDEKITVKENYLPVTADIITNKSDLTKFLLFGTLEKQDEYIVKDGDTVESVAYENQLSNEELLIANPNLSSVNSLLSEGQKLNIGLIDPLFTVVEETEVIEDVESTFNTVYEEDSNKYASESFVKQEGVNGVDRLTEKVQYKNGEIMTLVVSNTSQVSAPVDKVIVKGTKATKDYNFNYYPPAASGTDWGWPTISPYVITSHFGYRWGRLHAGIDISGSGFGSPIYSATDGVVTATFAGCENMGYYGNSCGGQFGNSITITSSTGLTIIYGHIKNNLLVSVGQTVTKGQPIGYMGNSGSSTGTHLHFEIRDAAGNKIDPCKGAYSC